jgi:hypothetical protein
MIGRLLGKIFGKLQQFYEFMSPFSPGGVQLPKWIKFPNLHSFNFILLHCRLYLRCETTEYGLTNTDMYMIVMTLLASILVYPAGGISYIDALFFAAGSATQSGLNT